ncbi:MAG: hypothetical protein QOG13_3032 [Sphingomonadales bacterium]|jgi:hypothetical protein|nr:hypothetical protein [Sphingomonadales bacterium]MEA3045099.1 hypothetical protein [Sphingomonadales bacterium]
MARKTLMFALASAAIFAAPAPAATPAPAQYDVRLIVRDGDAAPTTPRLLVDAGRPATFVVANQSYSMRVTATPDTGGRVLLDSMISSWTPDGLHNDASTITVDANGELSTILFPHTDPGTGATRQMRVDVSVRPASD